ncbi:hypothetical protein GCM10015535_21820 [Streptomyces gelaticus]|uniref:Secreted protein n=1 Tax=Streptomyces gelaticus TaxID=285446 RepID=A0ABQ2VVW8_9ACTN|nr:hypothetical protein GCM10015535_21820 [Streptomyces gelaticus]
MRLRGLLRGVRLLQQLRGLLWLVRLLRLRLQLLIRTPCSVAGHPAAIPAAPTGNPGRFHPAVASRARRAGMERLTA